jgi:hypothetical protein
MDGAHDLAAGTARNFPEPEFCGARKISADDKRAHQESAD